MKLPSGMASIIGVDNVDSRSSAKAAASPIVRGVAARNILSVCYAVDRKEGGRLEASVLSTQELELVRSVLLDGRTFAR